VHLQKNMPCQHTYICSMKKLLLIVLLFIGCNINAVQDEFVKPQDAIEAGRGFLAACNKGNFILAKQYINNTPLNLATIDSIEMAYRKLDRDDREKLRNASINIAGIKDSIANLTLIKYSNTYNKQVNILPITNKNDIWQVDFAIR
jgi:hypothetical protein